MSAPTASRMLRRASTNASRWLAKARQTPHLRTPQTRAVTATARANAYTQASRLFFSTFHRRPAGMMPDSEDPQPPQRVEEQRSIPQATEIDDDEYHALADDFMEAIHEKAEALQEEREDVEVEFSAGVLSISLPGAGIYIINKQPPNKQIWLSSPLSGPKRYDWCLHGESMNQKADGGVGDWVYLRDGTSLTDLLKKELGIEIDLHGHEERMQKSVDPVE